MMMPALFEPTYEFNNLRMDQTPCCNDQTARICAVYFRGVTTPGQLTTFIDEHAKGLPQMYVAGYVKNGFSRVGNTHESC